MHLADTSKVGTCDMPWEASMCNMQGARVASAMAAANPDRALACIFFSYPLHTPGSQVPERYDNTISCCLCKKGSCVVASSCGCVLQDHLRDSPLVELTQPILFVHGSKDTMCKPDMFQAVRDRVSSSDLQVYLFCLCLCVLQLQRQFCIW